MLVDLPQDVLKVMLIFVLPQDIIRLRKVCRYLNDFIKVCRQQLPMPGVEKLNIVAPSTDDPNHWEFILKYAAEKPDKQELDERKVHGINSLNIPIDENVEMNYLGKYYRSRSCKVPTSRLNEMKQELCQFRHSRLHIRPLNRQKSIWTDLRSLLQMLIDVYGECPTLTLCDVYFYQVDLTTVAMDHWRAFLAKI